MAWSHFQTFTPLVLRVLGPWERTVCALGSAGLKLPEWGLSSGLVLVPHPWLLMLSVTEYEAAQPLAALGLLACVTSGSQADFPVNSVGPTSTVGPSHFCSAFEVQLAAVANKAFQSCSPVGLTCLPFACSIFTPCWTTVTCYFANLGMIRGSHRGHLVTIRPLGSS